MGLTLMAPETGFLRASVGKNEVFSLKNPVSVVGCVSPELNKFKAQIKHKILRSKLVELKLM
jgi:hypothetical protein